MLINLSFVDLYLVFCVQFLFEFVNSVIVEFSKSTIIIIGFLTSEYCVPTNNSLFSVTQKTSSIPFELPQLNNRIFLFAFNIFLFFIDFCF